MAQKKWIMRYLGGISGSGVLKCNGEEIDRASYDFDGFFEASVRVTSCGEIRLAATALLQSYSADLRVRPWEVGW
jgi:hypothetical protein